VIGIIQEIKKCFVLSKNKEYSQNINKKIKTTERQMINLLNKLLARFGFSLVSTKKEEYDLVEATVKFMKEYPKVFSGSLGSEYIGDINYVKEKVDGEFPQVSGTTYYEHQVLGKDRTFFNFDGEKYTTQELQEKLNETL